MLCEGEDNEMKIADGFCVGSAREAVILPLHLIVRFCATKQYVVHIEQGCYVYEHACNNLRLRNT